MPDVVIIGAGPAGSLAAVSLARAGWDVTIVEQHHFPRDKVCGECVSALGLDVLRRHGLITNLERFRPATLRRVALSAGDGSSVSMNLPREMWGLSRKTMDAALLRAATDAGAMLLQPARCEFIAGGVPPVLRVRDLTNNSVIELRPSAVVVADGKSALLPGRPKMTGDLGVKAHFAGVDGSPDAVELFGLSGHYAGLGPVEDATWNLAFSVPKDRLAGAGDFDRLFDGMKRENEEMGKRFRPARRVGDWLASPLPRFAVVRDWPAGVIPVGNAAAALEPIGGEGMGLALRSAELATEALIAGSPVETLKTQFDELWAVRRAACRGIAMAMSRPALAGMVVGAAGASENFGAIVMRWMGKGEG